MRVVIVLALCAFASRGNFTGQQGQTAIFCQRQAIIQAGELTLPIISMFYGIIVRMYYADNQQHHIPHIHVEYGGRRAVFSIRDGELLAGNFPKSKTRLVDAWIEIHREELEADWKLAVNNEEVFKIDPLK
jgi:uncharacterized protein DUF4160